MRKIKGAILGLALVSQGVIGQKSIDLRQANFSVDQLINNHQPIHLNAEGESFTIADYEIKKISDQNYEVKSKSNADFVFTLNKTNNKFHGSLVKTGTKNGYLITQNFDGTLRFLPFAEHKCNFDQPHSHEVHKIAKKKTRGFVGNSDVQTDIFKLESRPGKGYFNIFLQFDPNGPIAHDLVKKIWESVSEDWLPFKVNITTNRAVYDANPGNRMTCKFADFGNEWVGSGYVGGGTDGRGAYVDIDKDPSEEDMYLFRTPSHELGHTFGLGHDGGGGSDYYTGHGEWTPIMGSGSRPLSQWSNGEYDGAYNTQDDIAIIASDLGFVEDDYPGVTNLIVEQNGLVLAKNNRGIIGQRTDVDIFQFDLPAGGKVDIIAQGGIELPDLDIQLTLRDENGTVIAVDAPVGKRSAAIKETVQNAGTYTLEVDGVSELTRNSGWTDYGSLGYYELNGLLTGVVEFENDFELLEIRGFGDVCGTEVKPTVDVQNNGNATITNFNIEVYIDGNLASTDYYAINLQKGEGVTVDLSPLQNLGSHQVEVKVLVPNVVDELDFNNSKSTQFSLNEGEPLRFVTNAPEFDGSNPFTWTVTDVNSGVEIINSSQVSLLPTPSSSNSQTTCVSPGCYRFDIESAYKSCGSYPAFSGGTYSGGDIVVLDGILYEAKWWNTATPPSSEWERLGECHTDGAEMEVSNPNQKVDYFNILGSDVNTTYSEEVCIAITSSEEIEGKDYVLYPNPSSTNSFRIATNERIDVVKIYNGIGQVVHVVRNVEPGDGIHFPGLRSGLYLTTIEINGVTTEETLIIK